MSGVDDRTARERRLGIGHRMSGRKCDGKMASVRTISTRTGLFTILYSGGDEREVSNPEKKKLLELLVKMSETNLGCT